MPAGNTGIKPLQGIQGQQSIGGQGCAQRGNRWTRTGSQHTQQLLRNIDRHWQIWRRLPPGLSMDIGNATDKKPGLRTGFDQAGTFELAHCLYHGGCGKPPFPSQSPDRRQAVTLRQDTGADHAGQIIGQMPIEQADRNAIGLLMAGVHPESNPAQEAAHG